MLLRARGSHTLTLRPHGLLIRTTRHGVLLVLDCTDGVLLCRRCTAPPNTVPQDVQRAHLWSHCHRGPPRLQDDSGQAHA